MDRYAIICAVLIFAVLATPVGASMGSARGNSDTIPPWLPPSPTLPPPTIMEPAPSFMPSPEEAILTTMVIGDVTVEGIVMAGTDDLTDCIYIQSGDRSWGMMVTLPLGAEALRGQRIKVTGTLEAKERSTSHIIAKKIDYIATIQSVPKPLGMVNRYVGDGYRTGAVPVDLSNLGLCIRSWGRVVFVDTLNKRFVVTDGSRSGSAGIEVYGGELKAPIFAWPKVGQYVMVSGISTMRPVGDGTIRPAVRLRGQQDLQVVAAN